MEWPASRSGFAAAGAGGRDPVLRLPARAVGRDRGVSDAEARHLHDRLGARLSERDGHSRQRRDQLFPDDPDQRVERARDRRSRAGRLRKARPDECRQALCQGAIASTGRRTSASALRGRSAPAVQILCIMMPRL